MLVNVFSNSPIVSIYFSPLSNTIYLRNILNLRTYSPLQSNWLSHFYWKFFWISHTPKYMYMS